MNKSTVLVVLVIIITALSLPGELIAQSPVRAESIDMGFLTVFPAGSYKEYSRIGFGLDIGLNLSFTGAEGFELGLNASYAWLLSDSVLVTGLQDITLYISAGYHFRLEKVFSGLSLTPSFGYGGMIHIVSDEFAIDGSQNINLYLDQTFILKAIIFYEVNEKFGVSITPKYQMFFEQDRIFVTQGHLFSVVLGTRFTFN
ncbi:MAG: hypothetical protein KAH21_11600 [Spirochaetaceae bacterium]|nr:hypothetical protein [Spirochaetaceae bacterium]